MAKPRYQQNLFAGRAQILHEIKGWADNTNPPYHLFSIVGPPGIGKTWLLLRTAELLRHEPTGGRLVFWINLSSDPSTPLPRDNLTDPQGREDWLKGIIQRAKEKCGDVILDFNPTVTFDTNLDALVRNLCERCKLSRPPVFMVDGFEEIADWQWGGPNQKWFEAKILSVLLRYGCIRVILARREETALKNPALLLKQRENIIYLAPLSPPEPDQQLQNLVSTQHYSALAPHLDTLRSSIKPYDWNHPYINALLIERAVQNLGAGKNPLLTSADLRDCVFELAQPAEFKPEHFGCLQKLVELPNTWSGLDLLPLGYQVDRPPVRHLFSLGMVTEAPRPRQAYKVADGIRELMQAWKQLAGGQALTPPAPGNEPPSGAGGAPATGGTIP
jgi:hypothetical protein